MTVKIRSENLNLFYGQFHALMDVNIAIKPQAITAIIGPSGCGKSTLLRCFNRLNELIPTVRTTGRILLDDHDIFAPDTDLPRLRKRVGMVFQRPNPFPLSVFDNVAYGLRVHAMRSSRAEVEAVVESSLRATMLWDALKDRLTLPALELSAEQQQRLCISRLVAVEPEVLLMDEPCSTLDPGATEHVEELMRTLARQYTIIIVTHNMQQAARISDKTGFFYIGKLIEYNATEKIFTNPDVKQTEDYIQGKFG